MKQLRLFEPSGIDLLAKLAEEKKLEMKPRAHWNGEPW